MSKYPDPSGYPPHGSTEYAATPQDPSAYQYPSSAPPPVVQAPIPQYTQARPAPNSGAWNTGLCDCSEDCASCCVGCWCPCVLVGKNVESIDDGVTSCAMGGGAFLLLNVLTGLGCIYTCIYRTRLREKYGIPGDPAADFCTDCCCLGCSICQVYRELEKRNALTPSNVAVGYPIAPGQQQMSR